MVSQAEPISSSTTSSREHTLVLIVEDEHASRRALALLLASCGYQPQAFATAEDALLSFDHQLHARIALVDLDLPGMNGLDLISRLEKLDPSIFPILITATDANTLAARLKDRKVVFMRKPIDFDVLLGLMHHQPHHN